MNAKSVTAALVLALCVSLAACTCSGSHTRTIQIRQDFTSIQMNKLANFYILPSQDTDAVTLTLYSNRPINRSMEYITINSDEQKGNLMLDAVGDENLCMVLRVPEDYEFNTLQLEGTAQVILGNWTFGDFEIQVNNGMVTSDADINADSLTLAVAGSGAIDIRPSGGRVGKITSSISGGGNITYLGTITDVTVSNVGYGYTTFGQVMRSMHVTLAGSGNTTVIGSRGLTVTGTAQPVCYIRVINGRCSVASEDPNFIPCISRRDERITLDLPTFAG